MNGLDLFSGIGGISLALREWVTPIAYCEIDRYAQAVLLSRMQDGHLSRAPVWDDVTTFDGKQFRGQINIIYGGFPCQDISVAGNGKGLVGERSWLFREVMRLAEEIKPEFIFLENVPAIRTRGLNHVAEWLASAGYDCRWDFVSAQEVGAPHIRQRWFCLAYANGNGRRLQPRRRKRSRRKNSPQFINDGKKESLANSAFTRLEGIGERMSRSSGGWAVEPNVGRVVNGLSFRVDRIKALGNSVVSKQTKEAFMRLMGLP